MTLKIAIAGAAGRMGQALVRAAGEGFAVVGGTERKDSPDLGRDLGEIAGVEPVGAKLSDSMDTAAAGAEAWLDFTVPEATIAALDALKSTPVRAVIIGTTGLAPDHERRIAEHAKRIAIVKAGNYSLGVNLLVALVEQAAGALGPEWDIEISETHHKHKADAPSGTALMMGHAAATGRGKTLKELLTPPRDGITGPRKQGSIGFAVTRAGGVIGDHEAKFASDEEILILSHRALDRAIFAKGALHAARWAAGQKPGLYSMRDVLGI